MSFKITHCLPFSLQKILNLYLAASRSGGKPSYRLMNISPRGAGNIRNSDYFLYVDFLFIKTNWSNACHIMHSSKQMILDSAAYTNVLKSIYSHTKCGPTAGLQYTRRFLPVISVKMFARLIHGNHGHTIVSEQNSSSMFFYINTCNLCIPK